MYNFTVYIIFLCAIQSEIWCLQKVIIQGNPRVYIEVELNFWQFVRNYRWWTVARRSVPNVSIMSSFFLWQSKSLPICPSRCHPSTHWPVSMPLFYPLLHSDATLLPITPSRWQASTHWPISTATLLPSDPSRCHMHPSICIVR